MARKNHNRSEASGSIHFDARTKTVMAEASHENVKEKVQAVREVVPGKSNNEVVMVLQYYDYNVEQAIQAYLEDGAKEALQEWNFTGPKPNKKRKNKKKGNEDKANEKSGPSTLSLVVGKNQEVPLADSDSSNLPNGKTDQAIGELEIERSVSCAHNQPSDPVQDSTDTTAPSATVASKGTTVTAEPLPQRQPHSKGRGHRVGSHQHQSELQHTFKERTDSEVSSRSTQEDGIHRKPHQGLEKVVKDLHRQSTSFERLRHMLDHEIDRSCKSLKDVFEELHQGLNNRETKLLEEMSVLKREASEMLEMRQGKAIDLKRQADRSDKLKDTEVSELRAEIKHFVSERRHDENVGRTTRFLYDSDHMMQEIKKFGEVIHVKSMITCDTLATTGDRSSPEDSQNKDGSNSHELQEIQDKIINSLRLQNHPDNGVFTDKNLSTTQNGSNTEDCLHDKTHQRQQQIPKHLAQSGNGRTAKPDISVPSDVRHNSARPLLPATQSDKRSSSKSSQEPSLSHDRSGSLNRRETTNSTQGQRGRPGRGRPQGRGSYTSGRL